MAKIIRIRFPLLNYTQFFLRNFQLGKQTSPLVSIQINDSDRFARRVAQLARDQQRSEMITRWDVPFARANENSGLLVRAQTKIPSLILDRIRRWNERYPPRAPPSALTDFRSFRSRSDASIRLRHNFHEAR